MNIKSPSLAILALLFALHGWAQSNIFSVSVYASGTSWTELCSLALPFPPHNYKLTEESSYEDAYGYTIMDYGHEREQGGVLRRVIRIESGSDLFGVSVDAVPSKSVSDPGLPGVRETNDLVQLVVSCVAKRGGHAITNELSAIQAETVCLSRPNQDVFVVRGDRFSELQRLFEQLFGAADPTIHSSSPVGNGRSLVYTPTQTGVFLIITGNPNLTILSIMTSQ